MARVELKNVSKVYDKNIKAVDSIDLDIPDKEFVVLVGPSGCGKSTTLRMIAGLEEVTLGDIWIGDTRVNDIAPKDRDIAMVFQNYALYPHMTVYQNMSFGLKLRKFSKKEIDDRVREAAEILGITDLLDRKPKALSGGQRQRVAVGRAIVRKPKVFLFDEPLSNLDAKLRVQMRTEISRLHTKIGTTMVYVTHDQVEAMTMGDRIVVMRDGVIQQNDAPLNLYEHPKNKFVAGFIGSPGMNFMPGVLEKNGSLEFKNNNIKLTIPEKRNKVLEPYFGKDVIFGIRPEDVNIVNDSSPGVSTAAFSVDVVEQMGNEIFIHLSSNDISLVGRINPETNVKVNSIVKIGFDMNKAHFFNIKNEEAIF